MFRIREPSSNDISWIYSTWISSWGSNRKFNKIDKNWVSAAQHSICTRIMLSDETSVLVACDENSDDDDLGYIVFDARGVLHWIYVKYNFRNMGIGGSLRDTAFLSRDTPLACTHWTSVLYKLKDKWNLKKDSSSLNTYGRVNGKLR